MARKDEVIVVRCKDCEYPHNGETGCPRIFGRVVPEDWYCADGKKKKAKTGAKKIEAYVLRRVAGIIEFTKVEGYNVPNKHDLSLVAYKGERPKDRVGPEMETWWYVIDTTSGISIGGARMKHTAVVDAELNIEKYGLEEIKKKIAACKKAYGVPPTHRD